MTLSVAGPRFGAWPRSLLELITALTAVNPKRVLVPSRRIAQTVRESTGAHSAAPMGTSGHAQVIKPSSDRATLRGAAQTGRPSPCTRPHPVRS